jgi:ferredoxin
VSQLVVDWLRCAGHGLCAELLPEVVDLDDWGYPVVRGRVPREASAHARAAVAACPALALRLEKESRRPSGGTWALDIPGQWWTVTP